MVKSSEVLRLAAEYAHEKGFSPLVMAANSLAFEGASDRRWELLEYAFLCDFDIAKPGEEKCMALCLAAAIAESEGD